MTAQRDLARLLATMTASAREGEYAFVTRASADPGLAVTASASVRETEGFTYVVPCAVADAHGLAYDFRAAWLTLDVHSALDAVGLTTNRNTVPFDERPPTIASGVRLGSQAATIRGFDEEDFREVGRIVVEALAQDADVPALRARAEALCAKRPLYPGFRGYTTYVAEGEKG